jgi:hypothetical protein
MEFTLARNHAGKLASSQSITRTEGAGLANQGTAHKMYTHITTHDGCDSDYCRGRNSRVDVLSDLFDMIE